MNYDHFSREQLIASLLASDRLLERRNQEINNLHLRIAALIQVVYAGHEYEHAHLRKVQWLIADGEQQQERLRLALDTIDSLTGLLTDEHVEPDNMVPTKE